MSLSTYQTEVADEWIDYNGHMSEAFYVLVFGYATDTVMEALGMGEDYRLASGCSLYTVEAHVRYLQEVEVGTQLSVGTDLVGASGKKLHLAHTMTVDDTVVATEEILGLHVDQLKGRVVPFPNEISRAAEEACTGTWSWNGRSIGV